MRVLVVSQMWPGPDDPDLGAFVAQIAHELEALGHEADAYLEKGDDDDELVATIRAVAATRRA